MTHIEGRLAAGEWRQRRASTWSAAATPSPGTRSMPAARRLAIFALPCDGQRLQRLCDQDVRRPDRGRRNLRPAGGVRLRGLRQHRRTPQR